MQLEGRVERLPVLTPAGAWSGLRTQISYKAHVDLWVKKSEVVINNELVRLSSWQWFRYGCGQLSSRWKKSLTIDVMEFGVREVESLASRESLWSRKRQTEIFGNKLMEWWCLSRGNRGEEIIFVVGKKRLWNW